MANLRGKQSVLFKVNEAGTDQLLRKGTIGEVQGPAARQLGRSDAAHEGHRCVVRDERLDRGRRDGHRARHRHGHRARRRRRDLRGGRYNKYVVKTGVAAPGTISLGKPGARSRSRRRTR
jgi:hypothetical protein